jgi:serine/threonine protein kinase
MSFSSHHHLGHHTEYESHHRGSEDDAAAVNALRRSASTGFLGGVGMGASGGGQRGGGGVAWSLKDFRAVGELGRGRCSRVLHVRHRTSRFEMALKCYVRSLMDAFTLQQVRQEVEIHAQLSHPDISKLYGWCEDERGDVYLMLELSKRGDVFNLICDNNPPPNAHRNTTSSTSSATHMPEAHACKAVITPIVSAVAHLHANGRGDGGALYAQVGTRRTGGDPSRLVEGEA